MSKSKRPTPQRPPTRPSKSPASLASRSQVTFVILSSLVICGLLGTAFVSLTFTDIFDGLFDDGSGEENFEDPNADIINAQETMVAENPDDVEGLLLLADLYSGAGRLGDAIPLYEKALAMSPDDVGARVSFAKDLADGDMQADAELQFKLALETDPNNQEAHYYLAELYMASSPQRTDEAIEHYQRAAEIDPTTLIGEMSQTQLDTLGAGMASPAASPAATPIATPA